MSPGEVVFVCSIYPLPVLSGGRKRTLRLIEATQRAGFAPRLLCLETLAEEHVEAGLERGWRVDTVPPPRPAGLPRLQQHARLLPRLPSAPLGERVRKTTPGAAVAVFDEIGMAQYVDAAHPSTPTVLSLHNVDSEIARGLAANEPGGSWPWVRGQYHRMRLVRTERSAARRADAVLCVSETDRSHFERFNPRTVLVPNGVDDALFELDAETRTDERVLFFAQWGYRPNVIGLLRYVSEGWPLVAERRPEARLRVAGGGLPNDVARTLEGVERVDVLGFVDDLAEELATARAVVVPVWQGSGTRLKVLEAMAAGRPIVGTSLGVEGVGFQDGVHGKIADDPAALGTATVELLADARRARRLGKEGRRLADDFRWQRATAPLEALLRHIAST